MSTDKAEWAKRGLSSVLRGVEKGLEALGTTSPLIKTLGGHPLTNPAGETYYSQTSFLYGDYIAKFALAPVSPNLAALKDAPVDMAGRRDGLREELARVFSHDGGTWEFRVQLLTDVKKMPVEDPSVAWPEDLSPYIAVTVEPQKAWSEERAAVGDDQLAFSPWYGMAWRRIVRWVRSTAFARPRTRCLPISARRPIGVRFTSRVRRCGCPPKSMTRMRDGVKK